MDDPGYTWNTERLCFEIRKVPGAPVKAVVWHPNDDYPATSETSMAKLYPGALLVPAGVANADLMLAIAQEHAAIAAQE